ncbi:EamA family transporter [uncultured Ilumatobacter sp.]|jgi:drug/metabolite transporter (DMT)-like permease|uniref:EamA family transporter n=1 Tax=uncultured Ilumatobacter sp. TaxID=879968 RepID=UPI00374E3AF7
MAILLGALAAVLIGCSDFLGRYGTRRAHAITIVSGALIGGAAVTSVGLAIIPSEFATRDLVLGSASGLFVGFALATLYEAMATSSAAIAGPLVVLGTALVPFGWDLAFGATLSPSIVVGIIIALLSLLAVMYSPGLTAQHGRGIRIALVSAVLWGISTTLVGESGDDSGVWAPFVQRITALVVMFAIASGRSLPKMPARPLLGITLLSGVLGGAGIIAFVLGTQRGSLGSVAVTTSMFPVVSSALSAAFDDDTLHWWQIVGITGVIGGIGVLALG